MYVPESCFPNHHDDAMHLLAISLSVHGLLLLLLAYNFLV